MFKPSAPAAHQLARRLRLWHARQGDPLALARCQHVVAVVFGHVGWAALQAAARTLGEPVSYTPKIARLKQLGYTADAADRLLACLSTAETAVEIGSCGAALRSEGDAV